MNISIPDNSSGFPLLMGIVNVTPDSFSDGGLYHNTISALAHARQLIHDGADMLDIGGESSRPGAEPVPEDTEQQRVVPVIQQIRQEFPTIPISVDTVKYSVARAALLAGANLINDISGLQREPRLAHLAAEYNATLLIMHSKGTPLTMQQNPHYTDVVREVYDFLERQIRLAQNAGVRSIFADVGIGFGKMPSHNLELLRRHEEFLNLGVPLVLGVSRKSLFRHLLGIESPQERDTATLTLHLLLLQSGGAILRVHNVQMLRQAKTLWSALKGAVIRE